MARVAGRYLCGVLLACAALAINGCNTIEDPKVQDPGGTWYSVAEQQLAAEATERMCGVFSACCSDAAFPYEAQGCTAYHQPRNLDHFHAQFFLGAQVDAEAAQRCMDSIGQASDGCPVERVNGQLTDACDWLFKGTVPLGGECDASHGCATTPDNPLKCEIKYDHKLKESEKSGVCIAIPPPLPLSPPDPGQACSMTCYGDVRVCFSRACNADDEAPCLGSANLGYCYMTDGLFCNSEYQCERQHVSSEPCEDSSECASGTYCNSDDSKCEPLRASGESCNFSSDCATANCADSKCAPPRPLGASCSEQAECGENYCLNGTCQRLPRATAASCAGQFQPSPSTGPSVGTAG